MLFLSTNTHISINQDSTDTWAQIHKPTANAE